MKTLTIEDILNNKKIIEKRQGEQFYSKVFRRRIEIADISPERILSIVNSATEDDPLRADYELIYECCPIFRSKELFDAYGDIEDPVMIVEKVFNRNIFEIDSLAKFILKKYGYYGDVETIKKQ